MSATANVDSFHRDPDIQRVMDLALEMVRVALGLTDDFANAIIAKRIIELVEAGERNPDRLCEGALNKLGDSLYGD